MVSYQASSEISSNFVTWANVKPGEVADKVQKTLQTEIDRLISEGPTEAELKRVKASYFSRFIKGQERIEASAVFQIY